MPLWFYLLTQFSIIAYAVIGGVFLAFSDFIMRSLAKTSGGGGVEAMQVINREVFRWVFMTLFIGLVPVSLVIGSYGLWALPVPTGAMVAIAGGVYIFGCFGVTAMCNVPLNKALADMDVSEAATGEFWHGVYLPRWTFWNSARTVACLIASALLLAALSLSANANFA